MGSLPQIFTGNHTRADDFIEEVRGYLCLNQDVAGFNSPMKKVSLTLTLIKGPEVAGWVQDMGRGIDQLDPVINNVPWFGNNSYMNLHNSSRTPNAKTGPA